MKEEEVLEEEDRREEDTKKEKRKRDRTRIDEAIKSEFGVSNRQNYRPTLLSLLPQCYYMQSKTCSNKTHLNICRGCRKDRPI